VGGLRGVRVILYHTAQSVFSPIHHLLSLVPYMFLLAHLTTVSLFLLAAYGLTGLSRGGQQVSKCKEVFGKAVKLLVDLVIIAGMHFAFGVTTELTQWQGLTSFFFFEKGVLCTNSMFAQILCFHNTFKHEVILDAVQILPLTNTNPC